MTASTVLDLVALVVSGASLAASYIALRQARALTRRAERAAAFVARVNAHAEELRRVDTITATKIAAGAGGALAARLN